jgi:hypothetical protein
MGFRLCKIERQRNRHTEQGAGKDDDTHSKHDACSVFVFWEEATGEESGRPARRGARR